MSEEATLAWRRVRVGSTNPPKLRAVRQALAPFAPGAQVEGFAAESGVGAQPVGFEEIVAGARNRAQGARASGGEAGVGYEDGLVRVPGAGASWFNVGCAAVTDGQRTGYGFSSGFAYPPACAVPAATGREPVGELFDALWQAHRDGEAADSSALSVGNVGRLTLGALPRAEYARHAVVMALLGFLHPDLYPASEESA